MSVTVRMNEMKYKFIGDASGCFTVRVFRGNRSVYASIV